VTLEPSRRDHRHPAGSPAAISFRFSMPNVNRGADDFMEARSTAASSALGASKVTEVDKTVGGIRYLPLPDDAKSVAAMKKIMPYAYIKVSESLASVRRAGRPTSSWAYDYLVAVGAARQDDVVYKIAQASTENKPKLAESFAPSRMGPADDEQDMPPPSIRASLNSSKRRPPEPSRSIRMEEFLGGQLACPAALRPDAVRAAGAARRLRHGLGLDLARPLGLNLYTEQLLLAASASPFAICFLIARPDPGDGPRFLQAGRFFVP